MIAPLAHGGNVLVRLAKVIADVAAHPVRNFKMYFVDDFAKRTQILLFMRTIDSTLRFSRGLFGMKSSEEATRMKVS